MFIKTFMIGLLFMYYYYFYFDNSTPVPEPDVAKPKPLPHHYQFSSNGLHHFQFHANSHLVWEHTFPDTYMYSDHKIVPRDVCYGRLQVAAKGEVLYEYMKAHPTSAFRHPFQTNDDQTVQRGDVFYFKCKNNKIQKLETCPSGKIFVRDRCQDINACTGQPDGTRFPHPNSNQFIECLEGKDLVKTCERDTFFRHDRCVSIRDLTYFCRFNPTEHMLLDGGKTRVHCERGKPVFKTCKPGTLFFERDVCESTICQGKADGSKLPLPETKWEAFKFVPGYLECRNGKVHRTIDCEQKFPDEVDEFFLPMVFDGSECVLPKFGVNVFSDDPETLVPVRSFRKHLQNWAMSEKYDRLQGWKNENGKRTLIRLADGMRVGKRFKIESACEKDTDLVPVGGNIHQYFDCATQKTVDCPPSQFFNGEVCIPTPKHFIPFNGLPIFHFDSLNPHDNWIKAWDYDLTNPRVNCQRGFEFLKIYNMCVQPECKPYAFLRLVPDLGMLLPSDQKAKCVYDESTKTLSKKDVDFDYSYWDQRVSSEPPADCVPGSLLKTGNFIWDSTIYATCLPNQPFVFCPVPLGIELVQTKQHTAYACTPPDDNKYIFEPKGLTLFQKREIKRILPVDPRKPITIQKNQRSQKEILPPNGLEIAKNETFNLHVENNEPVILEVRQRVTHPPNVTYEYDDANEKSSKIFGGDVAIMMKNNGITKNAVNFPRYNPVRLVSDLEPHHLVD